MTTIAKEKTFAFQEKELLMHGYKCEVLNRFASRYIKGNMIAFVMYVGNGEGFKTEYYEAIN